MTAATDAAQQTERLSKLSRRYALGRDAAGIRKGYP